MKPYTRQSSKKTVFRNAYKMVVLAVFAGVGLLAYGKPADVTNTRTQGAEVDVTGNFVIDECNSGTVQIRIYGSASRDKGGPAVNETAYADVFVYGANTCIFVNFGAQFSGNVQFSADDGNGAKVPKSATASGHLASTDGTDAVTFQFSVKAVGVAYQDTIVEHKVFPFGNQILTIDEKSDNNSTSGDGTLSVATTTLGTINVPSLTVVLSDYKTHVITVTRDAKN